MAWWLLVLHDWLTSTMSPYPYAQSIAHSVAAMLPLLAAVSSVGSIRLATHVDSDRVRRPPPQWWLSLAPGAMLSFASAAMPHPAAGDDLAGTLGTGLGSRLAPSGAPRLLARLTLDLGSAAGWGVALLALAAGLCAALCWERPAAVARTAQIGLALLWVSVLGLCIDSPVALFGLSAGAAICILAFRIGRNQVAPDRRPVSRRRVARALLTVAAAAVALAGCCAAAWRSAQRMAAPRILPALRAATPSSAIPPDLAEATVAMEDRGFYRHAGISPAAVHAALRLDIREGRVVAGGSTITQQLAKLLFLGPERTIRRKLNEAMLALVLERRLRKSEILSLYLSRVDYGMGRTGVRAAALGYFHKDLRALTLAEAATLAGFGPCPPRTEAEILRLADQRLVALARLHALPQRTATDSEIAVAAMVPVDHLVYPWRAAYDRGAVSELPGLSSGVELTSWLAPARPAPVPWAAPSLRNAYVRATRRLNRMGVVGIEHWGLFADRPMRTNAAALSAHAYGRALDIRAFRTRGGRTVAVEQHDTPGAAKVLNRILRALRADFDVVVDWHDDPLRHGNHIHVEMIARPSPEGMRR